MLAIAYTIGVAVLCFWDGRGIPAPPHSTWRFSHGVVRVYAVARDDILDNADIVAGDEILALNGQPLNAPLRIYDEYRAVKPGTLVRFTVRRNGEVLDLSASAKPNLGWADLIRLGVPTLVLLLLGVGVYLARPGLPAARLLLLFCLSSVLGDAVLATIFVGTGLAQRVMTFSDALLSLPSHAILMHLFLTFPARGVVQRRLFVLLPLVYGIQVALGLDFYLPSVLPQLADVLSVPAVHRVLFAAYRASLVVSFAVSAISLAATAFSVATYRVRQQARLLLFGFAVATAVQIGLMEIPLGMRSRYSVDPLSFALTDLIIPVFVSAAIVVHHLFDINVLVRHSLVYGTASAAVAVVFIVTFAGLGRLAQKFVPTLDLAVVAVASALAALAFSPVRAAAQRAVDRFVYRRRYNARLALAETTARLAGIMDVGLAADYVRGQIESLLQPAWVKFIVRRSVGTTFEVLGEGEPARVFVAGEKAEQLERLLQSRATPFTSATGEFPAPGRPDLIVPIVRGDAVLGALLLGPRRMDVPYLPDDCDFLAALASVVATVVERGQLLDERSLRERLALIGSATSAVVHELKNPLAAVKSTVAVLRRRLAQDSRGQELTQIVEREIDRLHDTVLNVLAYVRPRVPDVFPVNMASLVQQVVSVVAPEFGAAGVEILMVADEADVTILADPARLRQMLLNLLLNAREAMPRGGVVTVGLARWRDGFGTTRGVEITVADSGAGFAPENMSRIFEPFFTTKRLGTGLGLANVKQVVEDHHGEIVATNRLEGGAMVTVRLPAGRATSR